MSEEKKSSRPPMTEEERQKRIERLRRERRRKRRRQAMIMRAIVLGVLILILVGAIVLISFQVKRSKQKKAEEKARQEKLIQEEEERNRQRKEAIAEADIMAMGYDYDGAIELLRSLENYDQDADIIAKIADYEATKSTMVAVNMDEVTHIFYHSLVVDPERGFAGDDSAAAGFKQWMTTVDEFNKITQAMYDNGYVLVDLHDLVNQTTDEDGTVHFTTNQIMLPEGKKPFVLSLDDLSYYHSYDGRGTASKMILDENGKPTCEYIQADGTTVVGAYDCVPLLDQFLEEHPDGAYHGARGTIALTGYNGILGYRTDIAYKTGENLTADQQAWMDDHPDFDWDKECAEAKKVAEGMIADGWKFASHTWGHIRVGDASLESIKTDTEKWMNYVAPLIGGTDTIIFAHGQDLADWHDYSADNEKFAYLKSQGFNFFCNVDSSQYFLQIRDNYVRQGRRNLDGYRLWNDVHGEKNRTSDLFDASQILDPARTDMPAL
ncbi:MAG: polysaccharide deacetylase [Oliverpabstia sp.]|nr:polysaccharide deacetylase [Lachnospiraceae bacterium]MDY5027822.1 polysaccharide deacetylase [Oliverpabstia sp.]